MKQEYPLAFLSLDRYGDVYSAVGLTPENVREYTLEKLKNEKSLEERTKQFK